MEQLNSASFCSSMMNHHNDQPSSYHHSSYLPKHRCINTLEEVKCLIINLKTKKKKKEMDSAINKIEEVIQTIKVTMSDSATPALRPIDQIILEKLEKIESKSKSDPLETRHQSLLGNKPVSPTTILIKPTDDTISPQQLGAKIIDLIKNDSTLKLETTTIGPNGVQLSSFHSDIKNKIEQLIRENHLDHQADLIELKKISPPMELISSKPRIEREDLYKELTKRSAERLSSLSRQSSESSSGSACEAYMDGQGRLFRTPSTPTTTQHTFEPINIDNNVISTINAYNSLNNINIYESNHAIRSEDYIYGRSKRAYPHLPPKPSTTGSSDYGVTGRISVNSDINKRASNHDVLTKHYQTNSLLSSSLPSSVTTSSLSSSTLERSVCKMTDDNKDKMNGIDIGSGERVEQSSAAVSEECQQICAIFGDLSASSSSQTTTCEGNRACSEGSITPTNPDRSSSPNNEHSPSSLTSSSSSTNREPIQFSALKSTKSFPGNPIAESLYSSTGTLSRTNKSAPPPPVRKTSSISDPNAITLGTLRSAGVSTYEEIKTLKRNVRNHGGHNTYEELNSDRDAVYHAARKSCLSTSLTSLVEPIYSTLDTNTISISNPFNSKIVTINTSAHRSRRDSSNLYSHTTDAQQLSNSTNASLNSRSTSSTSTQSNYQQYSSLVKQRSDDDSLPPPPPEAYLESENHSTNHNPTHNTHNSHNRIVLTRREFLQTLNAKLSIPQNQRVSPKLVKRRSMSLPHSDHEWDSDSGITTQSSSSNESGSLGSSTQSESFTQSLVNQLTWWSKF